jgi:hypothetical protein
MALLGEHSPIGSRPVTTQVPHLIAVDQDLAGGTVGISDGWPSEIPWRGSFFRLTQAFGHAGGQ